MAQIRQEKDSETYYSESDNDVDTSQVKSSKSSQRHQTALENLERQNQKLQDSNKNKQQLKLDKGDFTVDTYETVDSDDTFYGQKMIKQKVKQIEGEKQKEEDEYKKLEKDMGLDKADTKGRQLVTRQKLTETQQEKGAKGKFSAFMDRFKRPQKKEPDQEGLNNLVEMLKRKKQDEEEHKRKKKQDSGSFSP